MFIWTDLTLTYLAESAQDNRIPPAEDKTEVLKSYRGDFKYQKTDQHEESNCGQLQDFRL